MVVVVAEAAPAGQEDCRQTSHANVDAQLPKSELLMRIRLTIYNFIIGAQPYIYLLLPWARNRGDYFVKSHFLFCLCSHKSFQVFKTCWFIYLCFQVRLVEDDWLHSGSLICPPCNEVNFAKLYFDFSLISLINYRFVSLTFDSPPAMWRAVRSGGFPVQGRDHAPTGPLLPGASAHLWGCSPPSPCPPPPTPPATTS